MTGNSFLKHCLVLQTRHTSTEQHAERITVTGTSVCAQLLKHLEKQDNIQPIQKKNMDTYLSKNGISM